MSSALDINDVKVDLKAIVTSSKNGVLLSEIEKDYAEMTGKTLLYQNFGFNNLIEFIQFLGVFNVHYLGFDSMITVLNDEKNKHLVDMIAKQKVSKKKGRSNKVTMRRQQKTIPSKVVNTNGKANKSNTSVLLKNTKDVKLMTNSSDLDTDEIKANLKAIIKSSKDGLLLSVIEKDYANMIGRKIPYQQLGFKYLIEFIQFLEDFNIEAQGSDYMITVLKNEQTKHLEDLITKEKIPKKNKVISSMIFRSSTYNQYGSPEVPKQSEHMLKPSKEVNTKGKASTWNKSVLLKIKEDVELMAKSFALDTDKIKANLKSIVTSSKDGLLLSVLEKDYANMIGRKIPYQQLGFKYLIEFIQFLEDFNIEPQGSDYMITLLKNVQTKHLEDLITKEKIPKKNKVISSMIFRSSTYNQYESPEVPKQSEHMLKPSKNSKRKAIRLKKRVLFKNTEDVKYIDEIKANLKAIIKSSKDGLLLSVIEKDYANMVGEPIPYHQLGFNYLIEFIRFIGDFNVKAQRFDYLITLSKNVKTKHLDDTNSKQKILNKVFSSIVIKSRASHQHERSEVPKQSEHMPKPSNDVNTKGKASTWKKRPLLKNTEDKIAKKNSDEEKVLGNIIKYIDLEAIIYEKYPKDCKLSSIDDSDMFIILDFIQNNIGQLEYRINALDGKWKKCSDFSTNLNIVHPTEFQQLQRFLDQLDARVKDLEEKKRSNSACIHKKIRRNSNMVCDALLEQNTHDQIQDSQEPKKNEIEIVAIGCKIIVVIPGRIKCTLYRVSIVDSGGETIYDKYIKPQQTFTDYRMALSGIRRKDIENGECFATVKQEVTLILKDKLLVGHSIQSILNVLHILHPPHMIRDITSYYKFKQFGQPCELKKLALDFLGIKLQNGEHSSVEHANVALQLYMLVQLDWESIFKK